MNRRGISCPVFSLFEAVGLPGGFHAAAGDIYRRLAGSKDAGELPELEKVLIELMENDRV